MERKELEQKAFEYFQAGFICAEAISKTILGEYSDGDLRTVPQATTGLGGGLAGTKCETCGALSGGVVALGFLYGRMQPGEDKQKVYRLAAEFRSRFLDAFGSTTCGVLLATRGDQENFAKCKRLTAEATGMLSDILQEEGAGKTGA